MMKRLLCISSMALLLVGCTMEQQPDSLSDRSGKAYSIECADYQVTDESGVVTKSVIGVDKSGSDGSQKVSNWNIWVYDHSTGNICNNGKKNIYDETMKTFFTQTSGIDGDLLFPDENGHYDIYILTNVEELTAPTTASAASNYTYTFSSYNSFKPENGGFPMATVYSNFCPATASSHTFMVQRLVSKYDVVIVNDIPNSTFNLSSVFLKQAAKKISPFQENSKISSNSDSGDDYDSFSSVELTKNSDGTYTGELFMLENNQGLVFKSGVSSDKDRIPGNMTSSNTANLCTYLEFAGDIDVADGHGQNNISFRHYFGSGRNAGVLRNVNTTVTLTLKDCPSGDGDWRIEPDDPYDSRTVVFEPTSIDIYGDGAWYNVTVTPKSGSPLALNNYINYTLSCPDASSANITFSGVNFGSSNTGQKTLKIKSTYTGSTSKTVKVYAVIDGEQVSVLTINVSKPSPMIRSLQIANDAWMGMLQDFIVLDFYPNDLQNNIEYFSGLTGTMTVRGRSYALETWPVEVEGTDYIAVSLDGSLTGNTDILVDARSNKDDSYIEFNELGMFIKTHDYYYKKASSQVTSGTYAQMIPYKLETFTRSTPIQFCGMKMVCDGGADYIEVPILPTSFLPSTITDIDVSGVITIRGSAYDFEFLTDRINGKDRVLMSINGAVEGWTKLIIDAVSSDDTFIEFNNVSLSTSTSTSAIKTYVPANGQSMSGLYYDIFPFYLEETATPENNIDFEWQYDNGFVSGAYYYYRLYKNGSWGNSVPVQNSKSFTSIYVDLTGATKIRLGCNSIRTFAPEQEEEPEEDDMIVIGYRNDVEYDSKSYCGGGKNDVYIDIPINSKSDVFKLELADY